MDDAKDPSPVPELPGPTTPDGSDAPTAKGIKRDPSSGRWLPGTKGGPGNPSGSHVAKLRHAMLTAVTPELMLGCIRALLAKALKGDVAAIREVFDRTVGKPVEFDLLERIQALEEMLNNRVGGSGSST